VLLQVLRWALVRIRLPSRAVRDPRLDGDRLGAEEIQGAVAVVSAFAVAAWVSWLIFVAHGQPGLDSLFEVVSGLGTVGLSTGLTAPDMPASLKIVLCVDMLLGRVEVLAVLVAISPRTWIGRRKETR